MEEELKSNYVLFDSFDGTVIKTGDRVIVNNATRDFRRKLVRALIDPNSMPCYASTIDEMLEHLSVIKVNDEECKRIIEVPGFVKEYYNKTRPVNLINNINLMD